MTFADTLDTRPLEQIPFAQSADNPAITAQVRKIYATAGLSTANEIIEAGCTNLVNRLRFTLEPKKTSAAIAAAIFVRERHDGAGFGLPCRVPPTHFCLVHNTIGGLQKGQRSGTDAELLISARPLTDEEQSHVQMVDGKLRDDAAAEAKQFFGLEAIDDAALTASPKAPTSQPAPAETLQDYCSVHAPVPPAPTPKTVEATWACPEHRETVWKCRYCLAAAIVNGPLEPNVYLELIDNGTPITTKVAVPQCVEKGLFSKKTDQMNLCVVVARWSRKMVRDT